MKRPLHWLLLWRSIRHTPLSQLLHRAAIRSKRLSLVALSNLFPAITLPRNKADACLSDNLPNSLIPHPTQKTVFSEGEYLFFFLNSERRFSLPIDWHSQELSTGTRLWKLHLHYFDHAEMLSDEQFSLLVKDWIGQNRPYSPGYWLDSWNSYAISIRIVAWMGEYQRRCKRLNHSFLDTWVGSIQEQLEFLEGNLEFDIGGNHLIKNIRALYWGSRFFFGAVGDKANSVADRLLSRELQLQILDDGFHFELSPAYHCQVFGDLLDCWRMMLDGDLKTQLETKLEIMAQVVADMTHPDGAISLFNDGGLNMAIRPSLLLDIYEQLFGTRPTTRDRVHYPQAGYHVLRTNGFYFAYDAGRVGPDGLPAHAHGDIFSFELTVGKQRMIVDTGVFEYNAGIARERSRSTAAHNTVTLDSVDQCEFWSAFRMGHRANVKVLKSGFENSALFVEAEHDGYARIEGNPVHRRKINVSPCGIISINDQVTGGMGQQAVSRLLLHPDVKIFEERESHLLLRAGTVEIAIDFFGISPKIVDAHWWPDFGCQFNTKQILIENGSVPGKWCYQILIRNRCKPTDKFKCADAG